MSHHNPVLECVRRRFMEHAAEPETCVSSAERRRWQVVSLAAEVPQTVLPDEMTRVLLTKWINDVHERSSAVELRIDTIPAPEPVMGTPTVTVGRKPTASTDNFVNVASLRVARIERPAGAGILGFLGMFVQRRNLDRVFGQTVADMREECIEAIAAKKPWRYRGAWFRGHLAIAFTVVAFMSMSIVKRAVEIWKAV